MVVVDGGDGAPRAAVAPAKTVVANLPMLWKQQVSINFSEKKNLYPRKKSSRQEGPPNIFPSANKFFFIYLRFSSSL